MKLTRDKVAESIARLGSFGLVSSGLIDYILDDNDGGPSKFGWFNYNNSMPSQQIPGGVWTTIQNDALGVQTNTKYSPPDVLRMLDPITGRVILKDLAVGDEVYIRHTVNVIPDANNTFYSFSHFFGEGDTAFRLPIGSTVKLDEGGGAATGDFLVDTHFFIRGEDSMQYGMLPQILVTNPATIRYTGCYISVNRR